MHIIVITMSIVCTSIHLRTTDHACSKYFMEYLSSIYWEYFLSLQTNEKAHWAKKLKQKNVEQNTKFSKVYATATSWQPTEITNGKKQMYQ